MDDSRRKIIKFFSLGCALIFLNQCTSRAQTDLEFRDASRVYKKIENIPKPLAVVAKVATDYMNKCFHGISQSYVGNGYAVSSSYEMKILKQSDDEISLAAYSADKKGSAKGYFVILMDLKKRSSSETEVASYSRHRLMHQAFKMWLDEGSDVCPQGCGVF